MLTTITNIPTLMLSFEVTCPVEAAYELSAYDRDFVMEELELGPDYVCFTITGTEARFKWLCGETFQLDSTDQVIEHLSNVLVTEHGVLL